MSAREIGLFPLASVLVPGELMPLHIFEERYKSLVADCREDDGEFALLYSDADGAREVGTTARVVEVGYHDFRAFAGECCRAGCADA